MRTNKVRNPRREVLSTLRYKMNIQNPVVFQLIVDLAILAAIFFLLWRINATLRNPIIKSHQEMMKDLKAVMTESQTSSENFLRAMEQSRLALKELALELDLKEKRVKSLLNKPDQGQATAVKRAAGETQDKYDQVIQMIRKGYSEAQTAEATGFTEPEIGLIVDLYQVKNENA